MAKNYYSSQFRSKSNNQQNSKPHASFSNSGFKIGSFRDHNTKMINSLSTEYKVDNNSVLDTEQTSSSLNDENVLKDTQSNDYLNEQNFKYKTSETPTSNMRDQEKIAIQRLLNANQELETRLSEISQEYKELCLSLEEKKAEIRLEQIRNDLRKEPIINLDRWIIRLPEPLNRSEKEIYFNRMLTNVLRDFYDIQNIAMGELLDDDVITTIMEVSQEKYPDMLFVNPCITQCIQFSQNKDIPSFLDPINAKNYDNIFFVMNDTSSGNQGTHWSLLLLSRDIKAFCHYDSLKGVNAITAFELSKKLSDYFNVWKILDVDCEQQMNNTDCGIFVLDNMLRIILVLKNEVNVDNEIITPLTISKLPPSFTKTRIYMMNTYISCILRKVKRTLRLEGD